MIFFDVDNTLIDHHKSEAMAIVRLCGDFKVQSLNNDELVLYWREISREFYNLYLLGKVSFQNQRLQRMRTFFSRFIPVDPVTNSPLNLANMSDQEIEYIFSQYFQYYEESWCAFDDVLPLMELLKNKSLGIITNGHTDQQIKKLKSVGILKYFNLIVTSQDVGIAKPDKRLFQHAAAKANVDISNCIYVGDNLELDAIGAMNAGMKAYWLNRNGVHEDIPGNVSMLMSLKSFKLAFD